MKRIIPCIVLASALTAQGMESIQEAINLAQPGDEIRVPPGTYRERIDFFGKSVRVVAWDAERDRPGNPEDHVITPPDDGMLASTISMGPSMLPVEEPPIEMLLEGFTIAGGAAPRGGGILIWGNVWAEIYRCSIVRNRAVDPSGVEPTPAGGGIYVDRKAQLTMISCALAENEAQGQGGALYVEGAGDGTPRRGTMSIVNCTISQNRSGAPQGAGIYIGAVVGTLCFANSILWENTKLDLFSEEPVATSCCLFGNAPTVICATCLAGDPLFAASPTADFRLTRLSPCVNAACDVTGCLVRPFSRPPAYTDLVGHDPVKERDAGCYEFFVIFVRGDVNENGDPREIGDAISILGYLFARRHCNCDDAIDANDSGENDIADAIYMLFFLFRQGPPPRQPFPERGEDPTEDELGCDYYP